MLKWFFAVVLSLILALPAQSSESERLAAAREMIAVSGAEKLLDSVFPTIMDQINDVIRKANPKVGALMDELRPKVDQKFSNRRIELFDMAAKVYATEFTKSEIDEIVAFYKTPTGQKVIEKMPVMYQQMSQIGQAWGQIIGQEVYQEFADELKKRGHDL